MLLPEDNPGGGEKWMTIARALPLILLVAGTQPALGETISADIALKRYRDQFQTLDRVDCPRSEEIVVCGWRKRELKAVPYDREGEPVHLLPGEPPGGGGSLGQMCTWNCVEPPKGGIMNIVKGIGALFGHDN
jgi:hypothetical protein